MLCCSKKQVTAKSENPNMLKPEKIEITQNEPINLSFDHHNNTGLTS